MRFDQIMKFLARLDESPQMLEEVRPMNLNEILLLARREGFKISNNDWKAYLEKKVRQASANVQLSDAELEQVAAGIDFEINTNTTQPFVSCVIGPC